MAKEVYQATDGMRDFGLRNQVTRAAVSIASNIAEGSERESKAEFIRFLRIAKASCEECRTQLYIADMVGYMPHDRFSEIDKLAHSVSKRIGALIKYLKSSPQPATRNQ